MRRYQDMRPHPGDGVIVSAIDPRSRKRMTWVEPGLPDEGRSHVPALLHVIAEIRAQNAKGANWRIAAISTPRTIYHDISGRRAGGSRSSVPLSEETTLGRLGALDLLHVTEKTPPQQPRRRFRRMR